MSLTILPDAVFPMTSQQCDAINANLVQLNVLDAGLHHEWQRALGLYFKIAELKAKTKGAIDYSGPTGHRKLMEDAMIFAGHGNAFTTRHGDLLAAHLAIAYHNAQVKTTQAGFAAIPNDVNALVKEANDFSSLPPQMEERLDLLLNFLKKRRVTQ